jgi:hypothetical protein
LAQNSQKERMKSKNRSKECDEEGRIVAGRGVEVYGRHIVALTPAVGCRKNPRLGSAGTNPLSIPQTLKDGIN